MKFTEPPKVAVYPESLYFPDRGSFNISCTVSGDPVPEAQWFFQNERIRPNAKYYITYKCNCWSEKTKLL